MVVQKIGDLTPSVIQDILQRSLTNSSIQATTTLYIDLSDPYFINRIISDLAILMHYSFSNQ